jgi:hypothetical protein
MAGARLRLGLHGHNRPTQTISPPLRGFLAQQILWASRSFTCVAAAARCGSPDPRQPDHNKDAMGATLLTRMEKTHG